MFRMWRAIISSASVFLLTACSDGDPFAVASAGGNMAMDSEDCRAVVADQLSREQTNFSMSSNASIAAYDQRCRFCMAQKGYALPPVKP